jgi:diguanylate cyclase (GGDEF)-like protein
MADQPRRGEKGSGGVEVPPTVRFANVTSTLPPAGEGQDARVTERTLAVPTAVDKNRANLTLLSGADAGQVFPLTGEDTIGRDLDANIRIDDPSLSRAHARVVRQSSGKFMIEDLGSTNGTFIGPNRIQRGDLVPGDRIQLGPKLILRFAITDLAEEMLQRQLFESSTRDHLTRIYNRRYLMSRLAAEVAHAHRHASLLTLLLFDLDRFKDTNDTYGHLAGDAVLRAVGDHVVTLIRVEDVFARYGGEEFVVLIRASGSLDGVRLAERLRASVQSLVIRAEGEELRTTISVGVAALGELGESAGGQELIALADQRLFRAKTQGRNRVVSSEPATENAE